MSHPGPIGMFDSGIGGLSVLAAARSALPGESFVYLADQASFPYGPRSAAAVRVLSERAARVLLEEGAKVIVVACNTASAHALAHLRRTFDVPFVGLVPAVKPAALQTHSGVVAVLATEGTLGGALFHAVRREFANGVRVLELAANGLASAIERGGPWAAETEDLLAGYCCDVRRSGADVVVLGCTHYGFVRRRAQELLGDDVAILDTADAVARQLAHVVAEHRLAAPPGGPSAVRLLTTGSVGDLRRTVEALERAGGLPSLGAEYAEVRV